VGITLLVATSLPALWIGGVVLAARMPQAGSAADLRRRAQLTLVALILACLGTGLRTTAFGGLAAGDRWFVQENLALLALAAVVLATAVPRLVRLRRATRAFAVARPTMPVPPTLRAAAAHPLIAVPVQATAYAAVIAVVVALGTAYPQTLVTLLVLAAAVTVALHAGRHRRLVAGALVVHAPVSSGRAPSRAAASGRAASGWKT
jgi:hypothetical protein